jgi:hypothetical protein
MQTIAQTTLETEIVLNATLDNSPETELVLETEIVPINDWPAEQRSAYLGKLRLLGKVHANVADKINETREATLQVFFRAEDNFIPETKDPSELVNLAMGKVSSGPLEIIAGPKMTWKQLCQPSAICDVIA